MAKKSKKARKHAGPFCSVCSAEMTIKSIIPAAHTCPEIRTYRCGACGNLMSVEGVTELSVRTARAA